MGVVVQPRVTVSEGETPESLKAKVQAKEAPALVEAVRRFAFNFTEEGVLGFLLPVNMKVTTKKSASFYVKSARSFFTGLKDKEPIDTLKISGLGDAINIAVTVATTLERENLCKIQRVETSYPDVSGA